MESNIENNVENTEITKDIENTQNTRCATYTKCCKRRDKEPLTAEQVAHRIAGAFIAAGMLMAILTPVSEMMRDRHIYGV